MNTFLQQIVTGISIGSIYALLAVGYALVFSVFNFSNFGFGPTMMFGAFAAYYLILQLKLPLLASILLGMVVAGIISVVFEADAQKECPEGLPDDCRSRHQYFRTEFHAPARRRQCARLSLRLGACDRNGRQCKHLARRCSGAASFRYAACAAVALPV